MPLLRSWQPDKTNLIAIVNADYEAVIDQTWGQVRTLKVRNGVHTNVGYANSNATFIEGNTGLIQFDAGNNIGQDCQSRHSQNSPRRPSETS